MVDLHPSRPSHISIATPATVYCDNRLAIQIATNQVFHERTKHIEINCHIIWEKINNGLFFLSSSSSINCICFIMNCIIFALIVCNINNCIYHSNMKYINLFDAQIDVVFVVMLALQYNDIKITVSKTGWPSARDSYEIGAGMETWFGVCWEMEALKSKT